MGQIAQGVWAGQFHMIKAYRLTCVVGRTFHDFGLTLMNAKVNFQGMSLQARGFRKCYLPCLEPFTVTDQQLVQLFTLIDIDLNKEVAAMGRAVVKQSLQHVFQMPPTGSAASSSPGFGAPGLAIQDGHPIAIADMPQQQLQRSAVRLQS